MRAYARQKDGMKTAARLQILGSEQQFRTPENNGGVDPNVRTLSHSNYFTVKNILGCRWGLVAPDTIYLYKPWLFVWIVLGKLTVLWFC